MTKYTLLLCSCIWQLSLASDKCLNIEAPTKEATQKLLSDRYPYWYNLAVAKKRDELSLANFFRRAWFGWILSTHTKIFRPNTKTALS